MITAFVFSDNIDGIMARLAGTTGSWGAFLDSVLDRVGDAAIFIGLALWFAGGGDNLRLATLCLACLALGAIVSYTKARAEGLGFTADVGLAERAERLVAVLVTTGLVGWFDLPLAVLETVLWLLAAASLWTIAQRMRRARPSNGRADVKEHLGDRLALLGYTAGWSAVRHLPEGVAYATFRRFADLLAPPRTERAPAGGKPGPSHREHRRSRRARGVPAWHAVISAPLV